MVIFTGHSVRPKKAATIPKCEWERHKKIILEKYYAHGLAHVKKYMFKTHGFTADNAQWHYRLYTVWNVKQSRPVPPSSDRPVGMNQEPVLANGTITTSFDCSRRTSQHDYINEEEEPTVSHRQISRNASSASNTSYAGELSWPLGITPRTPSERRTKHVGVSTPHSLSSRSASPYERNVSAASSYCPQDGPKRTASVSSQSSAPSFKRFRRSDFRSTATTPAYGDNDEFSLSSIQDSPSLQIPTGRDRKNYSTRPSSMPVESPYRSSRLKLSPVTTKKEIVFPCSTSTSKAPSFVRIRTVNPYALPEDCTDDEVVFEVATLPWEDMRQLAIAADIFTACKMFRQAPKMHHQIYSRISRSSECPWGHTDELMLKQVLAAARTSATESNLVRCRKILNKQLSSQSAKDKPSDRLRLRMALADIRIKQGDWNGLREHRANACEMLPALEDLPKPQDGSTSPDMVGNFVVLKAHALRASMKACIHNHKSSSRTPKHDESGKIQEAIETVEQLLALSQRSGIMKVLRWCRNQLRTVKHADLLFLRGCFGVEPSSSLAIKKLNIAALFGIFLAREYGTSTPDEVTQSRGMFGQTKHRSHGLDNMEVSSPADVLWIMAAVIVEHMPSTTIQTVFSASYFVEAQEVANKLLEMNWDELSGRVFLVMKMELSPSQEIHRPRSDFEMTADDHYFGAAAKLIMAVVRRNLGIVLEGLALDLEESFQPMFGLPYHAMSLGHAPASVASRRSRQPSEVKLMPLGSSSSLALDSAPASQSSRCNTWSSMKSMKRIKEQVAQHSFDFWTETMPKMPTWCNRDSWKKTFGGDLDMAGLESSLKASTISDMHSPRESLRLEADSNTSSPFKMTLTLKALRDIHERVDLLLPQSRIVR